MDLPNICQYLSTPLICNMHIVALFHYCFTENSPRNALFFWISLSNNLPRGHFSISELFIFPDFYYSSFSSLKKIFLSFTLIFLYEHENLTFLWAKSKYRISRLAQWLGSHFILCSVISLMNSQVEFGKWIYDKKSCFVPLRFYFRNN